MPATHLISVDLPAPLSPTSAITCPASTWKSTLLRARTAPKLLSTPFSSSRCCPCSLKSLSRSIEGLRGGVPSTPPRIVLRSSKACLGAVRLELPDADLVLRQEPVLDDRVVDVRLRDSDRGQKHRRRRLAPVLRLIRRVGLLALGQRD